jgi:hypothetical protein
MVEIKINGKPFSAKTLEEGFIFAAAEQLREKLGAIRHPETGEFPTIAIIGTSLADFKIQVEGSPELLAIAQARLAGESINNEAEIVNDGEGNMTNKEPPKVFLSFAFEDQDLAERIANALISQGIDTWWAGWCISSGDSIRQKIDEGLSGCTHFIVLLTPASVDKPWVRQEMDAGLIRKLSSGTKFIALRSGLVPSALPPLLQGSLSPAVDATSFDVSQLINDIHGISKKPALGPAPTIVRQGKEAQTGYSAAASILAKYFVEITDLGRKFEPFAKVEDISAATGLSHDDIVDAAHELSGLVTVHQLGSIYPEEELFVRFDKFWKPWDPAADALTIATHLNNDDAFPSRPEEIAHILGWEPRRLNPALAFLCQRKLVQDMRAINTGPWLVNAVRKTDATRRFVKSRQ